MQTILVPTDFSDCAHIAYAVAQQWAARMGADIHLLHVLDLPASWANPDDDSNSKHTYTRAVSKAEDQLQQWSLQAAPGLHVTTSWQTGALAQAAAHYVDSFNPDLIVIGSHGASGKSEYFLGSNTQRVVRNVHCPVLVVKEPLAQLNFDKVLFASHFHEDELPAFRRFKALVRPFLPEIHLVEVHTGSFFDPPMVVSLEAMQRFADECMPLPAHIHLYRDWSADRGIRHFANELGVGLIAISNHERRPLKRMLAGSTVEALVNHAKLPVLSIDWG